ncbi:isopenicillin N synthase family oxygenase [Rhizobium laguerreae]|uniref:isopenicillin N synthase family dioxygenase n=1 Tax=Rhizobium laguerreae TaxID=1076926 RepID=UPI001C9227F3|nr:2-oxoglutarate and iron-dependent oxygenase domain-containing protein [Rhizobium laguerreae]MBY3165689.1 isopenicillin N synthase family oxygenase [Rhizobium laguerreae]
MPANVDTKRYDTLTDQGPRKASLEEVPVIDLAPLIAGQDISEVVESLRRACKDTAFFYVKNHGVEPGVIRDVFAASREFFEAPIDERLQITRNKYNRGYIPMGATQLPGKAPDLKDSFDLGIDLPLDDPAVVAGVPFHGPNQWPADPEFKLRVERYFSEVQALGMKMLRVFALALDLEEEYFVRLYEKPVISMRLLHYPQPLLSDREIEVGSGVHTDYGVFTVLYQDPAGGLELQKPDGEWIAAPFIDDTFVINLGDLMARWTNDVFRSNPHRVVNRTGRERFSIAAFLNPTYSTVVSCLPTCQSSDNPARYEAIGAGEYVMNKIKANQFRQ